MKAIIQRVKSAEVVVNKRSVSSINQGLLIFLGIKDDDTDKDIDYIIRKILNFRNFSDTNEKFELSIEEINGEILVVSQFTIYGNLRKGTKPSFTRAMPPKEAETLYNRFLTKLKAQTALKVASGEFGAYMEVSLVNDGPSTFILTSDHLKQS